MSYIKRMKDQANLKKPEITYDEIKALFLDNRISSLDAQLDLIGLGYGQLESELIIEGWKNGKS